MATRLFNQNTDEENRKVIDGISEKFGALPEDYKFKGENVETAPYAKDALDYGTAAESTQYSPEKFGQVNGIANPLPDGMGYAAPSLAPKGYYTTPQTADRSQIDLPAGQDIQTERRHLLRTALEQKYGKAADNSGVEAAQGRADRANNISNFGNALSSIVTAQGRAHGGDPVDTGFWKGIKQDAQQNLGNAREDRQAKIADYLTQQKLGKEGVQEMYAVKEMEQKAQKLDPNSNVSRAYQASFAGLFPQYAEKFNRTDPDSGDTINGIGDMSANDIESISKWMSAKENADLNAKIKETTLGLKTNPQPTAKEQAETKFIEKKTQQLGADAAAKPQSDLQDAQTKYWNAKANEVETKKAADTSESLDVVGLGQARTKQDANLMRKNIDTTNNIVNSVDRIRAIKADGPVIPYTPRAAEIDTEVQFIMGQLRLPLQGPGAMTDSDRKQLRETIGDASSLFSINANTEARLNTIKGKMQRDLENAKKIYIKGYGGQSQEQAPAKLSEEDKQALEWANANPSDPKSAAIKSHLGVK